MWSAPERTSLPERPSRSVTTTGRTTGKDAPNLSRQATSPWFVTGFSLSAALTEDLLPPTREQPSKCTNAAFHWKLSRMPFFWEPAGSTSPGSMAQEPIGNLRYFEPIIVELLAQPLAADYRDYLRAKNRQLAKRCSESAKSRKQPSEGRYSDMASPEIVQ